MAGVRIDLTRVEERLAELAALHPLDGLGSCRLALTDDDRAGRDLLITWMGDLGLDVGIDAIGNIVGRWSAGADEPDLPPVMTGSHLDTVATGGRFDGALGVVAGLEVIEALAASGARTRRPVAVAAFTNEEGSRFAPDMMGSLVYVGGLALEVALDTVGIDGARVGHELDRIGYRGARPVPGPAPHAFVELHIEQGPVLEHEGVTIGAVTGVQGISWQELVVTGQSNHAGTTPMALRRDAGHAAVAIAAGVRELVSVVGGRQVGTVGRLHLEPNLVNVVAGRATMTVDLRNIDEAALREAEKRLSELVTEVAATERVEIASRSLARFEPVEFDERIVSLVESTATGRGLTSRRLASGAGHDAQMMARVCPTGMIFVPSRQGISHNPAEFTEPGHLRAGVEVLADVISTLAADPDPGPGRAGAR
jgi:beta-ureidopropionase / N-carbamoyl-L-amino-acid hydrolase